MEFVTYEQFGAVGDGNTDDFDAIIKAHDYANGLGLPIKVTKGHIYYIGSNVGLAVIKTDTDWTGCEFIIDDRGLDGDVGLDIFEVVSDEEGIPLTSSGLKKKDERLDFSSEIPLTTDVFVVAEDASVNRFKRVGLNESAGAPQTDGFIMSKNGEIAVELVWDFASFSTLVAYPIDEKLLKMTGGTFITVANDGPSEYNYYGRGIGIKRSNVLVEKVKHDVKEEGDHGSPYRGFYYTENCCRVTFKDCFMSGHKIYETIGSAGLPVMMGSYDINCHRSAEITFTNCRQLDEEIHDRSRWGVFGSNYCRDIVVEGCTFSRVDAHMGVVNLTVKDSVIGYMGIKVIGWGDLKVLDCEIHCQELIEIRPDYGSHWDGCFYIERVKWYVGNGGATSLILSENRGVYDFGYGDETVMPKIVRIKHVTVVEEGGNSEESMSIFQVSPKTNQGYMASSGRVKIPHPYRFPSFIEVTDVKRENGGSFQLFSNKPKTPHMKIFQLHAVDTLGVADYPHLYIPKVGYPMAYYPRIELGDDDE